MNRIIVAFLLCLLIACNPKNDIQKTIVKSVDSLKIDTLALNPTNKKDTLSRNILKINCDIPNIEKYIVRSETLLLKNSFHEIKYYDNNNRLLKIFESNLWENNSDYIQSSTYIYDTLGHLIYEDKSNLTTRWQCYCYKYDSKGHLVHKEGYGSGDLFTKINYIYKGDKLIKEIKENPTYKID